MLIIIVFFTSFISNSIINTNPNINQRNNNEKLSSNSVVLNKNYSTLNNKVESLNNIANKTKKISGLNTYLYNSKTVERKDIKDNSNLNKINNFESINNSKDDLNINLNINKEKKNIKDEILMSQIKKEILMPQTPQTSKETFMPTLNREKFENLENKIEIEIKTEYNSTNNNNLQDFINKNKEEDKNRINFLKEYKEILDKYGNNLNSNINN
jgi:hypothetical protein